MFKIFLVRIKECSISVLVFYLKQNILSCIVTTCLLYKALVVLLWECVLQERVRLTDGIQESDFIHSDIFRSCLTFPQLSFKTLNSALSEL